MDAGVDIDPSLLHSLIDCLSVSAISRRFFQVKHSTFIRVYHLKGSSLEGVDVDPRWNVIVINRLPVSAIDNESQSNRLTSSSLDPPARRGLYRPVSECKKAPQEPLMIGGRLRLQALRCLRHLNVKQRRKRIVVGPNSILAYKQRRASFATIPAQKVQSAATETPPKLFRDLDYCST
ncbi:uncharacterized protein PGTG_01989 [Puccinia graminis f. sp. tritici CRL 75-36-700-3]|uniref:Uncharacterized protein n=1 Tax=Puccinia graminis f. sp. tritici (strain CRL 75-36-700-3 / race SCCL) TaxID=418459 RepID=E3JTM1_PUCGT|nr:uncharacterized protein PGTG_01989 [Puccinia graminis f. sp. tritici CRL 75-36-700-3]EFP75396.2 hypothetical protein PGTG_01989 [Puccinia graminis f. sp. tritici CRL 75-36-700-3]